MTFFLLSRYSVSSITRPYLPFSRRPPSPFTFALFSPLSSSQTPTGHNVISEFLLSECGLSSSQVTKVLTRNPHLLKTASADTARQAIGLFRDSGFTEPQLKRLILRCPFILQYKGDGQLKCKLEFMKTLGLTQQHLANVMSNQPRVLTYSLEKSLRPKILYLENLFGSKVRLCEALKVAPVLMVIDAEKQIKPKSEYIKNTMGILEGSKSFLYALNAVLSHGPETLERKLKHLASLGFVEEEVHKILYTFPAVLNNSMDKLQQNMHFLVHTAGLLPNIIVSNPTLLSYSSEKRLKPRYRVFKYLSVKPHSKCLPNLNSLFRMSEQKFLQRFRQCNP